MTKFEEELMATAKMIPTSDGNEIKFKTSSALYDYLLLSNGEAELYLESQLQQQALPVVKDFVAEWYEEHKADLDFSIFEVCVSLYDDNSSDFKKWFGNSENKSIETLVRMKNGYQVEKPQLFYLKHIDMSKRDKDHDYFAQIRNDRFEHDSVRNNTLPGVEVIGVKFTQKEINSMQTGSYEKIEVAE